MVTIVVMTVMVMITMIDDGDDSDDHQSRDDDCDNGGGGGQRFCANADTSAQLKRKHCGPCTRHKCQPARFRTLLMTTAWGKPLARPTAHGPDSDGAETRFLEVLCHVMTIPNPATRPSKPCPEAHQ